MSDFIPLSVPHIRGHEWDYVKDCLDGEWVSSAGPFVDRFEKEFAAYVGAKYAVACSSGTAALHVALLIAGVKDGDYVLAPTLTFISSVNAIKYCGAAPVFFDCDQNYNMDADQVLDFLHHECRKGPQGVVHKETRRRVAAILPVHVFGNAARLEPVLEAANALGIPVVEDAAEGVGTRYLASAGKLTGGRHAGTVGAIGCFSFNGNKIVTTGGGGMLVTDDRKLADRAKYLTTQAKDDEARFVHNEVGFNYRLTNVQAAIGSAQMEKIEEYKKRKKEIFQRYERELNEVPGLHVAAPPEFSDSNYWMPCLQIDKAKYGEDREQLMARLAKAKIQARPVWELSHRQRPYEDNERGTTEEAERLHAITLNIPCSVGLTDEQQGRVIEELRRGR
jgi:perosamine synthetase